MNKNALAMVETVVMGVVLETKFHKSMQLERKLAHADHLTTIMNENTLPWLRQWLWGVIRDQVA